MLATQTVNLDDQAERSEALSIHHSFIVQAPAGSGKTEILIQRLLALLGNVNKPEEILAITFTKKAANEMRVRVLKALKQAQSEPEPLTAHGALTWRLARKVLARDAELKWDLLTNPNQLRIQTIDSLCSLLTKQLPLLAHFGAQPALSDQPQALYRSSVQAVLAHLDQALPWSQTIAEILQHLDNDMNKLEDLLMHLLAKRDQWLPYIQFSASDASIRQTLETHLGRIINEALQPLPDLVNEADAHILLTVARFANQHLPHDKPDLDLAACANLKKLPGTTPNDLMAWRGLARLLLTKSFTWRKRFDADMGFPALASLKAPGEKALHQAMRADLTSIIEGLSDNEVFRSKLEQLFYLPYPTYSDQQWQILQALLHVLKVCVAELRVRFQQSGQIDFIENTQAALLALGDETEPTDLALALDYQIRHILIDEFQDTSFTQYQLLSKLTQEWQPNDGRTLFVVGDPMQSIYRFREAEVGLFLRMRKLGIGHLKLKPLTLTRNFRSTSTIVDWNNEHFTALFPKINDIATGAVSFSQSIAVQKAHEKSYVEIHATHHDEPQQQTAAIVAVIQKTLAEHPHESIALLVRSRSHLQFIIPALKAARIPYRAIDIDPLAERQIIQDLMSLTKSLMNQADRIAWFAILRTPWFGLSLADLLVFSDPRTTIWMQLNNPALQEKLSADGQLRLKRALPILASALNQRDRLAIRTWIETTWVQLGGPAGLKAESDIEDVAAFFALLQSIHEQGGHLQLDELNEKLKTLYSSVNTPNAKLQLMTIHTAKGLEFDTVLIPHLERKLPSDDKALLSWMEQPLQRGQAALLLAPIHATGDETDPLYEYIQRQQRVKVNYEVDRLFYVATTRAKQRLHLFFKVTPKKEDGIATQSGSFLSKLWPLIDRKIPLPSATMETPEKIVAAKSLILSRLKSTWQHPLPLALNPVSTAHEQPGFKWRSNHHAVIGTTVHAILRELAIRGLTWWTNQTQHDVYIRQLLLQTGLARSLLSESVSKVMMMITNTVSDERGRWIVTGGQENKAEYPLTLCNAEGKVKRIIVDRTFIENDTRWIIDYKTAEPPLNQSLDVFLKNESTIHAEQLAGYREALSQLDKRPIRVGLYFPAINHWLEL